MDENRVETLSNLSLIKLTFGQKIRPYLWLLHYGEGRFGQAQSPGIFWWSNQKKNDVISAANGRAELGDASSSPLIMLIG